MMMGRAAVCVWQLQVGVWVFTQFLFSVPPVPQLRLINQAHLIGFSFGERASTRSLTLNHTYSSTHILKHTHTDRHLVWECQTPCGWDQTQFCFHWGPAEVSGGCDSSSILDRVLPLLQFPCWCLKHLILETPDPCVFKCVCSSHIWQNFPPSGFTSVIQS